MASLSTEDNNRMKTILRDAFDIIDAKKGVIITRLELRDILLGLIKDFGETFVNYVDYMMEILTTIVV